MTASTAEKSSTGDVNVNEYSVHSFDVMLSDFSVITSLYALSIETVISQGLSLFA